MTLEEKEKVAEACKTESCRILIEYMKKRYWFFDYMTNEQDIDKDVLLYREAQRSVVLDIIKLMETKK